MKFGAAYIRVSTDMQVELSPDSQLKMIEQYAKANDIILNKEFIYADDGISGRTAEKRPEFMKMISAAKATPKPFDIILVWKFSRFARNREDSIVYKSMLRKECGIDVVSVSEPVGEDKTSMLIEALLEAMDEYYSINLAEEVRRGMTEKASRGGVVNPPPFGYKMQDGEFVPDEKEAPIIKMIFEKYLAGYGSRTIALELNDLGIKTKHGNRFDNRNVNYILTNTVYIGKVRWNTTGKATKAHTYKITEDTIITDGKHAPIIEKQLFDDVQKVIADTKSKYPKYYNQRKTDYFFRGIVRCSNCGATLCQVAKGASLQCHNYAKGRCNVSHSINISKLKQAVIGKLKYDAENGTNNLIFEKSKTISTTNNNELILERIKKEEIKLTRIKAAYEDGIDSLDEYKTNKQKITAEIDKLNCKINSSANIDTNEFDTSILGKIADTVELISHPDISAEDFNSSLRNIISKIVFDRKNESLQIFYKL